MKKLFKNKKAVSPVIATVLMILVTMAGMTILFAFVASYSEGYKAGIGSSVMESLTVEDIWLSPHNSGSTYDRAVEISVYNVGKVDSTITSIYADGLKLSTGSAPDSPFQLDLKLAVGEHKSIALYWFDNWVEGRTYTFTIATQKGSSFDVKYTAP